MQLSIPVVSDSDTGPSQDQTGVKIVSKVSAILDSFSREDVELTLDEVAVRSGLPRATAYRLVSSLRDVGLIEQNQHGRRYRLGVKLFQLGSLVLASMDLHRAAPPFVSRLQQVTGETVHLCVFDGSQMVFVERQQLDYSPESTVTTLEGAPVHSTGVGKAFLAFQDQKMIERLLVGGLPRFTPATITEASAMKDEIAKIQDRGFAIDNGENVEEVRCVAAPLRNISGKVFGAISVSSAWDRMPDRRIAGIAEIVRRTADGISISLGWRNNAD